MDSFTAGPAAVLRKFSAIGRDIYGRALTRRDVYQLQAQIRQGNSGGPFVRRDGTVLGVVFAASTTEANVGLRDHVDRGAPEAAPGHSDDHHRVDRALHVLVAEHR